MKQLKTFISIHKIRKFNSDTVDYWNSVTVPEEKQILIDSSLKHRKIIIFLRIFIMFSYVGFAVIPATMAPIANRIIPGLNWTQQLCTTSELPRREQYFQLWFIYTIFIMAMFGTIPSNEETAQFGLE
uniref:Odorant receptor n=1 Tax=Trichogramma kaykai TaxID=54128 RepID=A0ABD2W435_9HYME